MVLRQIKERTELLGTVEIKNMPRSRCKGPMKNIHILS